jgi:hypothetical protein
MRPDSPNGRGRAAAPESYPRLLLNLVSVVAAMVALAVMLHSRPSRRSTPAAVAAPDVVAAPVPIEVPAEVPTERPPVPEPAPAPVVEAPPAATVKPLDRAAVAQAEAALDAASRDRARAEGRLAEAQRLLGATATEAASAAAASRTLAYRVRDPSAQIARLASQGGFVRAERDRLKEEVAALRRAPRPKPKSLVDRNPVAKPADGEEFHFEVRRNRVTFIDLDRLIKLVKADAQLRVRLADNQRVIESRVGPVGSFSMEYVLRRAPIGIEELLERHGVSFDLRGWELIPEFEGRGEPYETCLQPFSEFARTINSLNPERATITMWVYADGFPLYRKLRDDLHARGFLVAARPLPEGMPIKGSPSGSLSAGQ